MFDFPRSLLEFQRRFPDERACAAYLADTRWPDGFRCPACDRDKGWELATKAFTWECAGCGKQTSVTAGTVMHGSKVPLVAWFWAAYLMATHSNGISALQVQKQLGLGSYKTAWLLCAKLRRAMVAPDRPPLNGLVEIDETEIPQRSKDDPPEGGLGPAAKARCSSPAPSRCTAIGRAGCGWRRSRTSPPPARTLSSTPISPPAPPRKPMAGRLTPALPASLTTRTSSDRWPCTSSCPGHRLFANLKRWALGVYHGLRRKHLQSYLDEFVFRFNRRNTRHAAFRSLLRIGVTIKHITYNMLIHRKQRHKSSHVSWM